MSLYRGGRPRDWVAFNPGGLPGGARGINCCPISDFHSINNNEILNNDEHLLIPMVVVLEVVGFSGWLDEGDYQEEIKEIAFWVEVEEILLNRSSFIIRYDRCTCNPSKNLINWV